MKKMLIVLLILLIVLAPRIYWQLMDKQQVDVLVIDKTVPTTDYREHKGLFWLLENEKIVKDNNEFYDIGIDYNGYDPYEEKPMDMYKHEQTKDVIYIADTYGVYSDDLKERAEGERSEKIYGGMDIIEWNEIMKSKGPQTTLIAEYNSFATPTEETTRKVMEKSLSVEWSGWAGRYFTDLTSDEVPNWMRINYENQYKKEWTFTEGGLVFVHISDKIIVIEDAHLYEQVPFKLTEAGARQFDNVRETNYHYWFDIVQPTNGAEVLAQYELAMSEEAQQQLQAANIPLTFPAITHHSQQRTYYFSGDFADYTKDNMVHWYGGARFMSMFSREGSNFQWAVYVPVMREIFAELQIGE